MIEKVLPHIYRLEIPLPNNPLKSLNSYVIKGKERNLIVDTGMKRPACLETMQAGLKELEINLAHTDFFLTHMHSDHTGLTDDLATNTSQVYCSQADAAVVNSIVKSHHYWDQMAAYAGLSGFPQNILKEAILKHPGYKYGPQTPINFSLVKDGDIITVGEYQLHCIATPGHTQEHLCLYEPSKKILFSGDHILRDITPNISLWSDTENPLANYLYHLDKIKQLDINIVLPAHRRIIHDYKQRIEELKTHHKKRVQEVLTILETGTKNAYQVASEMSWDMTYKSWEDFPIPQKWFALGEAIAHLKYLEEEKLIKKIVTEKRYVFYTK